MILRPCAESVKGEFIRLAAVRFRQDFGRRRSVAEADETGILAGFLVSPHIVEARGFEHKRQLPHELADVIVLGKEQDRKQ